MFEIVAGVLSLHMLESFALLLEVGLPQGQWTNLAGFYGFDLPRYMVLQNQEGQQLAGVAGLGILLAAATPTWHADAQSPALRVPCRHRQRRGRSRVLLLLPDLCSFVCVSCDPKSWALGICMLTLLALLAPARMQARLLPCPPVSQPQLLEAWI